MVIPAGRSQELNCELDILSAFYPSEFLTDYTDLFLLPCTSLQSNFTFSIYIYTSFIVFFFTQVRMQALKCFSVLAFENPQVSMTLVNGKYNAAVACLTLTLLTD